MQPTAMQYCVSTTNRLLQPQLLLEVLELREEIDDLAGDVADDLDLR